MSAERSWDSIRLGERIHSNSVYEGFVISLWRVPDGIQVLIRWGDTSGYGWGAPNQMFMAHELTWAPTIEAWTIPRNAS